MVQRVVRVAGQGVTETGEALALRQVEELHQPHIVHGPALLLQQEGGGGGRLALVEAEAVADGGRFGSHAPMVAGDG